MNITDKNFFDSGTSMGLLTCGLSEDALAGLCREAVRQKKSSVWVFPNMIENARRVLEQSGVSLGTVVRYILAPLPWAISAHPFSSRIMVWISPDLNAPALKVTHISVAPRSAAEDVRILAEGLGADGIVSSQGWTW